MVVLMGRQVESELKLEKKFQEICEVVTTVGKQREETRTLVIDSIDAPLWATNELEEGLEEQCMMIREKEKLVKKLRQSLMIARVKAFQILHHLFKLSNSGGCCTPQKKILVKSTSANLLHVVIDVSDTKSLLSRWKKL
ncbi:hypothetical protein Tco_1484248 [Tanacetum coccineum]